MKTQLISLEKIKKTIIGHKLYVIIIAILVVGVIRGFFSSSSTSTNQQITNSDLYTVVSGSIENTIKVIGTTKITNQQHLTFQAAGGNGSVSKVTKLYVKEGDTVKAGQLLAELDKKSFSIQLSQQALSIQNSKLNYTKLLDQYTESDKIQAQKNVDDMKVKLDVSKNQLKTLESSQGNVVDVNAAKIQTILITTQNIINDGKNILNTIDEMFYITKSSSRYMNVQIYLSAKNSSYKSMTETNFYQSKNKISQLENDLSSLKSQTTAQLTSVKDIQAKSQDFLIALYTAVDSAKNAVENSIDGVELPLSTIQSRDSSLIGSSSKVLSYQNTVSNNISDLNNTNNDIINKKNEISNYEAQLQIYQAALQTAINGPDATTRQLQANSIAQSSLSYQQLSQQKDNYEIVAPFDGMVNTVDFKQGDNVDNTQGITVSNPNSYEVNVLIDQIDIVNVNKGQSAEISFDAYPGYIVTGIISSIDPTPITTAGVVSYYAKISLVKGEKTIYDSMTVNVNIIVNKKENVLIVPNVAIQSIMGDGQMVQIMQGSTVKNAPIIVGITDGINSEIFTGVSLGDTVLLKAYTIKKSTSSSSSSSPFGSSDPSSSMRSIKTLEGGNSGGPSGGPTGR